MTREKEERERERDRQGGERKLETAGTCQLFTGGFLVSNVKIVLTRYSEFLTAEAHFRCSCNLLPSLSSASASADVKRVEAKQTSPQQAINL